MIQRAHFVTDKEEIIRLWQQCFGDERHYVEFFLENCPKENALFLYRKEDAVVGMMFLMPGILMVSSDIAEQEKNAVRIEAQDAISSQKLYYLYALCVDENFRGKGIAQELLDFAKQLAKQENAEVCLVPSTEELRRYYAKRGFIDVFACTEQVFDVDTTDMFFEALDVTDADINLLMSTRIEAYGNNAFLWEKDNLEFAIKENSFTGGFAYFISEKGHNVKSDEHKLTFCGGTPYIIGDIDEGVLQIRETNLNLPVIYRFAGQYNCDKIRFLNIIEPFEKRTVRTRPYAMVTNQGFAEKFVKSISFDKRYINFCFD